MSENMTTSEPTTEPYTMLPCEHCGNIPLVVHYEPRLHRPSCNHPYCIVCNECEMLFGWDIDYGGVFDTIQEAIDAWNRRYESGEK